MSEEVQKETMDIDNIALFSRENLQNASALLALLHGKSDSICKIFDKEIIVTETQLNNLKKMIEDKLSLHKVIETTMSFDISLSNKEILTFKSWADFKQCDFSIHNSAINSVFVQWDFFLLLQGRNIPQRHTISVRISSSPKPSEYFKVMLSGGLDEESDIEMRMHTTICKVDFINNTLAEELIAVVENWNNLCESAISKKSMLSKFLFSHNTFFAYASEITFFASLAMLYAIFLKWIIVKYSINLGNETLFYLAISFLPCYKVFTALSKVVGRIIYRKFGSLMETHIFNITAGDVKKLEKINVKASYRKELTWFVLNSIFAVALALVLFLVDFVEKQ